MEVFIKTINQSSLKRVIWVSSIRKSVDECRHSGWKQLWDKGIMKGKSGIENGFYGKTHSDEARKKITTKIIRFDGNY